MKKFLAGAALASLLFGGIALSQIIVPKVTSVGPSDLFQDVVNGIPQSNSFYATAAQVNGVQGYFNLFGGADAHGQTLTYTATAGVSNIFAFATTSAITSVTITTEAHPGDGQRECYIANGEATTSLTFTPNTGQTLNPTITAGVSNQSICITYQASNATWYRSN